MARVYGTYRRPNYGTCPGSGQPGFDGRHPGDEDRCSVCGANYVVVKQDGTLRSHKATGGRRQPTGGVFR